MAKKTVGTRIKEARTYANLTQEKLAKKVGLTATDISKAERDEKQLTQTQLKNIAKVTGVTQKSLLEGDSKTSSTTLTNTEKQLLEAYRKADTKTKKAALALLKGKSSDTDNILSSILNNSDIMDTISQFFK